MGRLREKDGNRAVETPNNVRWNARFIRDGIPGKIDSFAQLTAISSLLSNESNAIGGGDRHESTQDTDYPQFVPASPPDLWQIASANR